MLVSIQHFTVGPIYTSIGANPTKFRENPIKKTVGAVAIWKQFDDMKIRRQTSVT